MTVHRIKGKEAGFLLHAGGMSGTAENCVFTECVNDADVIGDIEYDDGERNAQVLGGGLAGTATGCRFTECVNREDVKCAMACGENDAAAMLHAGGIAAKAVGETLFDQCSNQGSISAEGYNVYSGGIASYIVEAAAVNCVNHGSVLARSSWEAISGGICAFGGATGQFDFTAKVANCANYGRVNSETDDGNVWSGGILGSSMSISTEPFLIENCVSGGTLTGEGTGGAEPGYRAVAGICAYGTKTVIRHCFWLGSTAQEPVILDEGEDPAASTAVFDSAIYDRKNGSCLLREEISGTYSLTEALNLWAGEHSGEDGFDFDGWRMKDGKASPAAGLAPSAALDLEHTGDRDAAGRSAGSRGKSGFSPKWTQDEKGWRYQTSPVEFTAGGWANLYWDGAYYWYHFNAEGYLDTGWFTDTDGAVYYLHPLHDGKYGYMYTGLNSIDGKEYYFETETGKGKGALYRNRTAPDGRTADKSGALLP